MVKIIVVVVVNLVTVEENVNDLKIKVMFKSIKDYVEGMFNVVSFVGLKEQVFIRKVVLSLEVIKEVDVFEKGIAD